MQPICLIDMDNTLFDYEGQMRADLKKLASPEEVIPDDLWDENVPWLKERMRLIKNTPGWWVNLPKFKLGWDLYFLADELGFKCRILTKGPSSTPSAWVEKFQCIKQHFDNNVSVDIVGEDKSGTYGHVLIDDYGPYVLGWLEYRPRGLVIMPAQPYNAEIQHPNIIRYTGENIEVVTKALQAVKLRQPGEHWKQYLD